MSLFSERESGTNITILERNTNNNNGEAPFPICHQLKVTAACKMTFLFPVIGTNCVL